MYVNFLVIWWFKIAEFWENRLKKAFEMDPEAFLDLANQVAKVKMYPYFDLAHAVVCCLIIKEDMGSGKNFKM